MAASVLTRREWLVKTAVYGSAAAGLTRSARSSAAEAPKVPEFPVTVIAGKPRERGRQYGRRFQDGIRAFLDKEIYQAFVQKPSPKEEMLHYAGACAK